MENLEFGTGKTDKEKLLNFVDSLEKLLTDLTDNGSLKGYFIREFEESYQAAWKELNPHISALKSAVEDCDPDRFARHGLLGAQLEFKLRVINYFASRFFALQNQLIELGINKKIRKILKNLLQALDKFLASLLDAVGAGGAVAEYKDFLESIIEEEDD